MTMDRAALRGQLRAEIDRQNQAGVITLDEQVDSLLALIEPLVGALDAMVIVTPQGQPCYRSSNGLPMGMPRAVERKVRKALAQERP